MFFVWFDDSPKKSINKKIDEAILRYKQKYGKAPNVCMLSDKTRMDDFSGLKKEFGIEIRTAKNVPQNYFWIAREAKRA